ncbi:MAG: PAS domain S-box protein [Candidatus Obscuribacterales bacterium]|nr:PAS domain S-box protein [Candidatus Obscuribacterales bacterium]
MTYRQFSEIDEQSRYVNHTHLTLSCLDDIQTNCLQVENANRALALTSEPKYFEQKQTAKAAAFDKLKDFQHLTVDNFQQQKLIPRLSDVMTERFAVADKISEIAKVNIPRSPEIQTVVSKGSSITALLDSLVGQMKAEEERLLVVRLRHQSEETQRTRMTLFALGCFALFCLAIAVWMIWIYFKESKESELLFRAIFDNTYQFTGMLAADGKIINANKTSLDFSDVKSEDVAGVNFWDLTWWNDAANNINGRERIRKAVEDAGNGKFVQLETDVYNRRNQKITIDMSLKPILDESGKVLFIIPEGRDITQRVKIENTLKINEHKLKSLLACLAEGVYQVDQNGNVIYLNAAAETMLGYSQSEIMGKNMHDLIHTNTPSGEVRSITQCSMLNVIRDRQIHREPEDFYQRKDGSFVPVEFVSSPIIEGDECVGAVIAFQDITLRKESENRVSEFYSTVSHELRTPLTSIRGALRLLEGGKGGEIGEKAMKLVKMGRTECDRLVRLINDMLDIRKIEAGKLELKPILLKASLPIAEALENLAPYAAENHVKLRSDIIEDFSFQADQDRLTQILTNLISNAIKFSPADGTVLIKVGSGNVFPDGSKSVRFEVIDNGCGISEAAQQKLFGLFQQVDSSDSRAKGGTGLGLAITKALVEQHRGKIGIISKENEGSTFWFELPLDNTEIPVIENATSDATTSEKPVLLLVEDDVTLSTLLTFSLQDTYQVKHADSVEAACVALKQWKPMAILLDLHLPDGHGDDLIDKMKDSDDTKNIPIVTMSGQENKMRNLSQPVIIDFLKKPFDEATLRAALLRAQQSQVDKTAHILVAEDDELTVALLKDQIERLGHTCRTVRTGEEALEAIQHSHIDLLVLDLGMPGVGGAGVIEALKQAGSDVPLIVYTARDLSTTEKRRLSLGPFGATKHLTKSVDTDEDFLNAVKDMLNRLPAQAKN